MRIRYGREAPQVRAMIACWRAHAVSPLQVLVAKVKSLEADVEGLRVLEDENQRLRDRVGSLMSEVDKASRDHANETHRLKKEVFNLRMQLEQVSAGSGGPILHAAVSCSTKF